LTEVVGDSVPMSKDEEILNQDNENKGPRRSQRLQKRQKVNDVNLAPIVTNIGSSTDSVDNRWNDISNVTACLQSISIKKRVPETVAAKSHHILALDMKYTQLCYLQCTVPHSQSHDTVR